MFGTILTALAAAAAQPARAEPAAPPPLSIAADHRHLEAGGEPWFWLGDTAWLLLSRLDRDETERYIPVRERQGFNVIQVMLLHTAKMTSRTGQPALVHGTPARQHRRGSLWDRWSQVWWTSRSHHAKT